MGLGLLFALLVGAVIANLTAPRSSPSRANSRSYALVLQRICALHARFDCLTDEEDGCCELTEAKAQVALVEKRLGLDGDLNPLEDRVDPSWTSGAGYQDLWTAIHRAEEALIVCASRGELEAGIIHDKVRVKGSHMPKSLEEELDKVTTELYGLPSTPPAAAVPAGAAADPAAAVAPAAVTPLAAVVPPGLAARLREIRRALNEIRDERWDGLVRARLRLVRSALMTAWTAYGLLILALALHVPRDIIAAGCVFFIVGALVGLVAQVRSDARLNEAVEDYGLTAARLYQTVLASGLAGVAGVLLMPFLAEVASAASGAEGATVTTAFNVALNPGQLILAAIFGLSPQVIFDRLTASADEYKAQLSTTPEAQPAAATPDAGATSG